MSKATLEMVNERLEAAQDWTYHDFLYRQHRYAFGNPLKGRADTARSMFGGFPIYPDVADTHLSVGVSRRIMNVSLIHLSRIFSRQFSVDSPDADLIDAEVRKRFFERRFEQFNLNFEMENAFLDGDSFGMGCVQIGVEETQEGFIRTTLSHVPILNLMLDKHQRNPAKARWGVVCSLISYEEAVSLYGRKEADNYRTEIRHHQTERGFPVVPVFDYWDIDGCGKGTPTQERRVGGLDRKPVYRGENFMGDSLPLAFYTHVTLPGWSRPIGRVFAQMATQEAINDIERKMRAVSKQKGVFVVETAAIEEGDLKRWASGNYDGPVKTKKPMDGASGAPMRFVNGAEIQNTDLQLLNVLERQMNADSGTNDYDNGNFDTQANTATEAQILEARSSTPQAWSDSRADIFRRDVAEKFLKCASLYDTEPTPINFDGAPILLNDPENPQLALSGFLSEPSRVVIAADALQAENQKAEANERLNFLLGPVATLVQMGKANPDWWAEEIVKAGGDDPQAVLQHQPAGMPAETASPALMGGV